LLPEAMPPEHEAGQKSVKMIFSMVFIQFQIPLYYSKSLNIQGPRGYSCKQNEMDVLFAGTVFCPAGNSLFAPSGIPCICPIPAPHFGFCYNFGLRMGRSADRMISLFGKNEPEPTLLERLKNSVSKTKAALSETVDTIFLGERKIDPSILKDLETALLGADLGVKPTREILEAVREKMDRNKRLSREHVNNFVWRNLAAAR
jgi:hypothetical protein